MKIVVCVALTPDTDELGEISLEDVGNPKGDLGVTMVLNPWDEFAVEEALLTTEVRLGGETLALAVGDKSSLDALKRAVAMGIDEGLLVSDPILDGSDAWGTAAALAQAIRQVGEVRLVLAGKQSVGWQSGLVPAGLAAKLGWPFVSEVVRIVEIDNDSITLQRLLDEGLQTLRVPLPAVVAVSKQINEPRYPTFLGIKKASRMQFATVTSSELPGLDRATVGGGAALTQWTDLRKPAARSGRCTFVQGASAEERAAALADRLIAEKVI